MRAPHPLPHSSIANSHAWTWYSDVEGVSMWGQPRLSHGTMPSFTPSFIASRLGVTTEWMDSMQFGHLLFRVLILAMHAMHAWWPLTHIV